MSFALVLSPLSDIVAVFCYVIFFNIVTLFSFSGGISLCYVFIGAPSFTLYAIIASGGIIGFGALFDLLHYAQCFPSAPVTFSGCYSFTVFCLLCLCSLFLRYFVGVSLWTLIAVLGL